MSRYYVLNHFAENGFEEIVAEDHNGILEEVQKWALVYQLYNGKITLEDIPSEWQEEIQRRVDERIAAEGEAEDQDIPAEEALEIILGGAV